ncbi:protein phosphatase [Duganella sp. 1224]|uniref:PP2C family protein-serine/threonine phosphatase n=1 Tax=Duganella sp. 1224 TaxID=2587052 RepID=UPI0015C92DFE|nr:protein phosphatase 2C domain-containing protein [Duganella sp. 1224]NYE60075.1 protein phosphatase [Duganella sp. 1224]
MTQPALRLTEIHGLSDTGDVRRHNEDDFLIDPALGLAAVADGMGGHQAGEVASAGALSALHASLREARLCDAHPARATGVDADDPDATAVNPRWRHTTALLQAIQHANAKLYAENRARGHADGAGMGCTLTGFLELPGMDALLLFHVGDSRLYRYRDGELAQLTRDQTAYQLALESGAPGGLPPHNLLLQAVGPAASLTPDISLHALQTGDLLLLCSDGLHGWAPHAELAQVLALPLPLTSLCGELIALAKHHSSRDNITTLLARCM